MPFTEQHASPAEDPIEQVTSTALAGKKAFILGIANDQSIAYGCARALRAGVEISCWRGVKQPPLALQSARFP